MGLLRRRSGRSSEQVVPAALVAQYLDDTSAMLAAHRRGVRHGTPDLVGLPKVLLEMVRCLTLGRYADPRHAPGLAPAQARLRADLLATERLAAGPALDQQVERLSASWAEYVGAARPPLVDGEQGRRPAGVQLPGIGSVCDGSPHAHPLAVGALRTTTPCVGLVTTAERAFTPA